MATQEDEKKIFTAPGEGAHLPVLDIVHKVTAGFGRGYRRIVVAKVVGCMSTDDHERRWRLGGIYQDTEREVLRFGKIGRG